jgi:DNA-binding response OmpR family regulator
MTVPLTNPSTRSKYPVQIHLAEADDELRASIAAALTDDGHDVVEYADGPTLFVELEERLSRPGARRSLVIAQAQLPGLSALRILHSLRQLDIQIPMILMTQVQGPTLHDLAEREGASAVLFKPIQIDHLRRVLAAVVGTPARKSVPSAG